MHRPRSPLRKTLRGLAIAFACASVLLTSFEDEVLCAATVKNPSGSASAPPADPEESRHLFPDLSRPGSGDREDEDRLDTGLPRHDLASARRAESGVPASQARSASRPLPRTFSCVWRI